MANNDYYNTGHGPGGHNTRPQAESIYESTPYQPGTVPVAYPPRAAHSPPPPSYTSQPLSHQQYDDTSSAGTAQRPGQHASPFVTDFDDHVYPASRNSPATMSQNQLHSNNTSSFAQETGYHGANGSFYNSNNSNNDDIPLQDRLPHSKPDTGNDHVYEAGPGSSQPQAAKKRHRVHFGELGMWGSSKKRIPFVTYLFTAVQIAVFIAELVRNSQETGSAIMTKPSFNPMVGPSPYVLIVMGARYVPCMHEIPELADNLWRCPNTTTNLASDPNNQCTLGEACGFGAPHTNENPGQWFRFILPIFLHAGIIHIAFNMLLQLTIGREMEMAIGAIRYFLVYMSAGIFGFVMGGNYGGTNFASVGASGSLFGIIALTLLDLLYSWRDRKSPVRELIVIVIEMTISFALGLLPGLDNFAHIGGFIMGLALGISVLHSPNALRARIGSDTPYTTVIGHRMNVAPNFFRNPVGFFKGRKPLWWGWWLIRAGALILVTIGFILLLENFYVHRRTCSWCKYLSCLPISDWCDNENIGASSDTSGSNKRDLLALGFGAINNMVARA